MPCEETDVCFFKQSFVYKIVQDCPLHAEVYCPEGTERKPGILWLHGGGLIFGNRYMLPPEQMKLYIAAGYIVVSIDYRLAPETKLEAIIADVQDAYRWVLSQGADLFHLDPDRLAVIGHSAGGYLALMLGCSYPRPKALVSFYGYGDITGKWPSHPDPHYTQEPTVSPEIAYGGIGGALATGSAFTGFSDKRWLFYLFCRQQGLWLKEVTGYDLKSPEVFDPWCPIRHVNQDYPPTMLLHGDQDTDVSCELSKQMAISLERNSVTHQLIILEGRGHVFDRDFDLCGRTLNSTRAEQYRSKVAEAFHTLLTFLSENVR
jgi:acetyl esterase/lipase